VNLAGNDTDTDGKVEGSGGFWARLAHRITDVFILRTTFYALLGGTFVVLAQDLYELHHQRANTPLDPTQLDNPILPSTEPARFEDGEDSVPRRPQVTTAPEVLRNPLSVELQAGGVLKLTGSITPGAADRFRQDIQPIREYVERVELDSPGGSVMDALDISEQIRGLGFRVHVAKGALCASSCPIIFAGGVERTAGDGAAIGVHQIYSSGDDRRRNFEAVSSTQTITARITRHLDKMGVDPALWIHALETPPNELYYLNTQELEEYRLVGKSEAVAEAT